MSVKVLFRNVPMRKNMFKHKVLIQSLKYKILVLHFKKKIKRLIFNYKNVNASTSKIK